MNTRLAVAMSRPRSSSGTTFVSARTEGGLLREVVFVVEDGGGDESVEIPSRVDVVSLATSDVREAMPHFCRLQPGGVAVELHVDVEAMKLYLVSTQGPFEATATYAPTDSADRDWSGWNAIQNPSGTVVTTVDGAVLAIEVIDFLEIDGTLVLRRPAARLIGVLGEPSNVDASFEGGDGDPSRCQLTWAHLGVLASTTRGLVDDITFEALGSDEEPWPT